jgi:hypothetical protein
MAITLPTLADKQLRETRLDFLDARIDPTIGDPEIVLIGDDNESLNRSVGWDAESTKVVTGRFAVSVTRSEETMTIDPYFIREGEPLGLLLQYIDENALEGDAVRRTYYTAKFDNAGTFISAFKMNAWVMTTEIGGDASDADTIVTELMFDGIRIPQNFTQESDGSFSFSDITTTEP